MFHVSITFADLLTGLVCDLFFICYQLQSFFHLHSRRLKSLCPYWQEEATLERESTTLVNRKLQNSLAEGGGTKTCAKT